MIDRELGRAQLLDTTRVHDTSDDVAVNQNLFTFKASNRINSTTSNYVYEHSNLGRNPSIFYELVNRGINEKAV